MKNGPGNGRLSRGTGGTLHTNIFTVNNKSGGIILSVVEYQEVTDYKDIAGVHRRSRQ
jgi:hypothetical protein